MDNQTPTPALMAAYKNLYETTRRFLEYIEPLAATDLDDESLVNQDDIDDLNAAYQEVFRVRHNA